MNERSYSALFALPLALAIASFFGQSSESSNSPQPKGDQITVSAPAIGSAASHADTSARAGWPLHAACHVLADYFDLQPKPKQKAKTWGVSLEDEAGNKSRFKVLEEGETKDEDCSKATIGNRLSDVEPFFVFVPDPNASALSLETDRSLDAIRTAFGEQGYIPYRTNVLLWKANQNPSNNKMAELKPEGKKDLERPGIWLFRSTDAKNDKLKLIFLIGDSPILGISKIQFANALRQHKDLFNRKDLWMAGPFFSGSVKSLGISLRENASLRIHDIHAVSGTAELPELQDALRKVAGPGYTITLLQLAKKNALKLLLDQLPGNKKAVLREADTAFGRVIAGENDQRGGNADNVCYHKQVACFGYSRDLLNLRGAYESDSNLMSRIFPKSLRPDQLPIHFKASQNPSDALPIFSLQNAAVSQQIALRHFASSLQRQSFKSLVIVSSDSLDAVFLTRFFQQATPNLRLGVLDSDVLLDTGSVSLRGVLTISQQPTGAVALDQIEQPGGAAFGIYRAVLYMLASPTGTPDTVVSVVGFDGEWPLKAMEGGPAENIWRFIHKGPVGAFFFVFAMLTAVPGLAYWLLKKSPWLLLTRFAMVVYPFSSPTANLDPTRYNREVKRERWAALLVSEQKRERWLWLFSVSGVVSLFVPFGFLLAVISSIDSGTAGAAIAARYFSFANGVSPVLPLCALIFGLHACVWIRVRSCYLQSYVYHPKPCPLPLSKGSHSEEDEVKDLLDQVEAKSKIFFGLATAVFLSLSVPIVLMYDVKINDIEIRLTGRWHELATCVWTCLFCVLSSLAINTVWRFGNLWFSLQNLLRRLEYHPLRTGFTHLPDRVSWSSIWSIGGLRPNMIGLQMTADFLCAIDEKGKEDHTDLCNNIDSFMKRFLSKKPSSNEKIFEQLWIINEQVQSVCGKYIEELVDGAWKEQRVEGWRHSGESKKESNHSSLLPLRIDSHSGGATIETVKQDAEKELVNLKNQVIALQYASFIRYAFMQLRNLLGYLGTSMTMLFVSLNVYPFQPIGTMTNFASLLFGIASFWWLQRSI